LAAAPPGRWALAVRRLADVRWSPGEVIVRREVWQGRVWLAHPLYVVEDTDDALVLYQAEGAPWGFGAGDDWPTATGRHPYDGLSRWMGEGRLGVHRSDDPYAVWALWGRPGRSFGGWYVNIQVPYRRTEIGIDSLDLELDLVVSPTYEVAVKDEDHVAASAARGRFSADDAVAIHAVGARVKAEIEAGDRWWDERWSQWTPPPELLVPPVLTDGWQDVPAERGTDLGLA
jgi:hypothetical protein